MFHRYLFFVRKTFDRLDFRPDVFSSIDTFEDRTFPDERPSTSKLDALPFHSHEDAVDEMILVRYERVVSIRIGRNIERGETENLVERE